MADFLNANLPWIMTSLVMIAMAAMAYFARQNTQTVGGTIRLETVQGNVSDIKDEMKSGFNSNRELIEDVRKEIRDDFRQVFTRIELLEKEGYNIRWRLQQLENKNGGTKSPV